MQLTVGAIKSVTALIDERFQKNSSSPYSSLYSYYIMLYQNIEFFQEPSVCIFTSYMATLKSW